MAFEKPAPRKTKQEAVATILHLHGGVFLEGKKKYISNIIFNIVKLRQGSGKDRQGMAVKAKGLKA